MRNFESEFRINRKACQIVSTTLIAKRCIENVTEVKFTELLENDRLMVYENRSHDVLDRISPDDFSSMLRGRWSDHIADSDDFDLRDFVDGYCFTAEFWKGQNGIPIIVLYYHH